MIAALTAEAAEVRFVGGCVRDAVLQRKIHDIDIATHDPPDQVLKLLRAGGVHAIPTGIDHGTVTAVVDRAHFEITTLRLDVETDGRRARVAYTDDWRADAARRDFTINALYCDPDGSLYDPFGGLRDLKAGRIRFVGAAEDRIREDVLRLLRFFRFYASYGCPPPDRKALAACRALAHLVPHLSGERVAAELLQLLAAPNPLPSIELMRDADVLAQLLPEVEDLSSLNGMVTLEGITFGADSLRRLAALLSCRGAAADGIARQLRFSTSQRERLVKLTAPAAHIDPAQGVRDQRRLLYRLGAPLYLDLALLAWSRLVAAGRRLSRRETDAWHELLHLAESWKPVELPVKGKDVLALGIEAGPQVGRILSEIEAWWIDGDFQAGRKECMRQLEYILSRNLS